MTVAIFRSWSGATLVLSLHVLNPQPCWVLNHPPATSMGIRVFPHTPSLLLFKLHEDPPTVESSVLPYCALNLINLSLQRAEDPGGFLERRCPAAAPLDSREWALLLSWPRSAWFLLACSGNSCWNLRLKFMGHVSVQRRTFTVLMNRKVKAEGIINELES